MKDTPTFSQTTKPLIWPIWGSYWAAHSPHQLPHNSQSTYPINIVNQQGLNPVTILLYVSPNRSSFDYFTNKLIAEHWYLRQNYRRYPNTLQIGTTVGKKFTPFFQVVYVNFFDKIRGYSSETTFMMYGPDCKHMKDFAELWDLAWASGYTTLYEDNMERLIEWAYRQQEKVC